MSQIRHTKTLVQLSSLQTITMNQYCCWKCMQINLHQLYMFNMALTRNKGIFLVLSLCLSKTKANIHITILHVSSSVVGMFVIFFLINVINGGFLFIYSMAHFLLLFVNHFNGTQRNWISIYQTMCAKMYSTTLKKHAHTCFNNFLNKLTQVSANLLNEF